MKGRVLVVDDDLALAEMLGIVLRHEGQSTQALPILKDSLFALSREPGFFTVLAQMELAQACFEMNFKDESVAKFTEAINMARQLKHHDIEKRALDMLSKVDRTEWAKALRSAGGPTAERNTTRAILSLVCCELRNTSWLWEQEVDRITAMLDGYYEAMAQSISKQRGIVIQIVGSRVIAVFGLEASCDPVQGLRCAETCQEAFFKLQDRDRTLSARPDGGHRPQRISHRGRTLGTDRPTARSSHFRGNLGLPGHPSRHSPPGKQLYPARCSRSRR